MESRKRPAYCGACRCAGPRSGIPRGFSPIDFCGSTGATGISARISKGTSRNHCCRSGGQGPDRELVPGPIISFPFGCCHCVMSTASYVGLADARRRSVLVNLTSWTMALALLFCGGCAVRTPLRPWRLVSQNSGELLIPPDVSNADVAQRTLRADVAPGGSRCQTQEGGVILRAHGKRAYMTVNRDSLVQ